MNSPLCLYGYFRSSAAYRVRIALNLKGLDYTQKSVNLLEQQQRSEYYLNINPQGLIPALDTPDGLLTQSLAILEWLESRYPQPPLIPGDAGNQALIRSVAYAIACDVHPLNNLRVQSYLHEQLGQTEEAVLRWYHHWIEQSFTAIEATITASPYCFNNAPSLADVCLIPQVYNAQRFNMDLTPFGKIQQVYQHCLAQAPFAAARPERQQDAP